MEGILDKIVIRSCAVRHYIVLHGYVPGDTISYPMCCLIVMEIPLCRTTCCYIVPGAITRDGDRKSWDARGPMIWDNFSIFRTNCAILTSYIHARVVVSRVDVVTLRGQILRIARFSCGFFTAMAGNKEPGIF